MYDVPQEGWKLIKANTATGQDKPGVVALPWDLTRLGLRAAGCYGEGGESLLVQGENRAVLQALLPALAGQVRMVYLDPPYNTGGQALPYEDNLDSGAWLWMIEERLALLRLFLRPDGVIFIQLDGAEMAYCKVATDRLFGRQNYITTIVVQSASPSGFKTANPGPADVVEFILMYAKDRAAFPLKPQFVPCARVDLRRFSRFLENQADPPAKWRFIPIRRAALAALGFPAKRAGFREARRALGPEQAKRALEQAAQEFALREAERVFETKTLQRPGAKLAEAVERSRSLAGVQRIARQGKPDLFLYRGRQVYFLSQNLREIEGRMILAQPMSNLWTDIPISNLHTEGGVDFRNGKKPEKLLARLIEMSTEPGDLVLDAFAGSGTAGAVAQKLGRRWVLIEAGSQAEVLALPRLARVVAGNDEAGIGPARQGAPASGFVFARPDKSPAEPLPVEKAGKKGALPALVVAAVIRDGERVFLAQRKDNRLWEFPGGKVEAGEDPREALRREIREELRVDVGVGEPLEVIDVRKPRHLVILFLAAEMNGGEPQAIDCADFGWFRQEELGDLPLAEADRKMADKLGRKARDVSRV